MAKAMHPGRAGQDGYFSVLLARERLHRRRAGPSRGRAALQSCSRSSTICRRLLDRLGERYELLDNTYKPYPTGIVIQPTIEAYIQIFREHHPVAAMI